MVVSCCVRNCKNVWFPNSNISYHRFPWKNKQLLEKWLDVVPSKGRISKHSCICKFHFKDSDYEWNGIKHTLKRGTVPTFSENDTFTNTTESNKMKNVLNENVTKTGTLTNSVLPAVLTDNSSQNCDIQNDIRTALSASNQPPIAESFTNVMSTTMSSKNTNCVISGNNECKTEDAVSRNVIQNVNQITRERYKSIIYQQKIKRLQAKLRRRDMKVKSMIDKVKVLNKEGWLTSVPFQQTRAYCLYCKKNLHAHRLSLLKHTCTMKHQRAALAHEAEKKRRRSESGALEVGLVEEVETADDSLEAAEENEEDIEYIIERLDTDDEDMIESQEIKETEELADEVEEGEEEEKGIDKDLYAQLQSDDENTKPVIKKIKLMHEEEKCRDTLAEAMAHVHSEYLEDEVGDQEAVQMEMMVEQPTSTDVCILPESTDDTRELSEDDKAALCTELKAETKSTKIEKVEGEKGDLDEAASLPILDTVYQTDIVSEPVENAINFVPIAPNLKTNQNKTVTLTCGSKTFTLTGGTFQPGTQYILTKLKGKSATLIMADQKKSIVVNELDKNKILQAESAVSPNINQSIVAGTSQQSVGTNQQTPGIKGLLSKKTVGKLSMKSNVSKKLRISTYVVDNTKGLPISGLQVSLYKLMDGKWTFLNESNTNINGFCIDLVEKVNCTTGRYKLHYDVDKYFTLRRIETMFPFVEVVFDVKNPNTHYHMPLLLSPFSYTIYRGT